MWVGRLRASDGARVGGAGCCGIGGEGRERKAGAAPSWAFGGGRREMGPGWPPSVSLCVVLLVGMITRNQNQAGAWCLVI